MDMIGVALIIMAAVIGIVFLAWQNQKDRKKLMDQMNRDYRKSKDQERDADIDEIKQ